MTKSKNEWEKNTEAPGPADGGGRDWLWMKGPFNHQDIKRTFESANNLISTYHEQCQKLDYFCNNIKIMYVLNIIVL